MCSLEGKASGVKDAMVSSLHQQHKGFPKSHLEAVENLLSAILACIYLTLSPRNMTSLLSNLLYLIQGPFPGHV